MKEELITLETAKLAKEKGFDLETTFYRQKSAVIGDETILPLIEHEAYDWNNYSPEVPYYSIPTQTLLQKWLREEQRIIILVHFSRTFGYYYRIDRGGVIKKKYFATYEEALEEGLQEALKLIK